MASWALVLGASSGFGAAIARALAAEGLSICGLHLDRGTGRARAAELQEELASLGVRARLHNANAARDEVRVEVLDDLHAQMDEGDTLAVLVHSLAFGSLRPLLADEGPGLTRAQVEMTSEVMGHSLAWWARDVVERGLMVRGGRILALTSAGARQAWSSYGAVSAAKSALEAWTRQCALELAPRGITVNAIQAGVCDTPSLRRIPGHVALLDRARAANPSGRLTLPEDVARCVVALSRPETSWLTGSLLHVDGGEHLSG